MEATELTGPAKNLLRFATIAREPGAFGSAQVSFADFGRGGRAGQRLNTPFGVAVQVAGLAIDTIPERFLYDPSVVDGMRRVIEERRPDIVQTHSVKGHFLMRFVGLSRQRRWMAFHHGYTTPNVKMRLYNQLDRWSLRAPDQVITVCTAFAQQLGALGISRDRIEVLPNSIEGELEWTPNEVQELRSELRLEPQQAVLVAIGRLSAEKAHADLLHAAAALKTLLPGMSFRVVLVGDGPERQTLQRIAERLGLVDLVTFAGYRSKPGPFLRLADVFVLPSHSEGSPNVLLEAMVAAVPTVATSVGGIPDMVQNESNGLLVAPGQPKALAEAMARLLRDRELAARLGTAAKQTVARDFRPEVYRDRLLAIYRRQLDFQQA